MGRSYIILMDGRYSYTQWSFLLAPINFRLNKIDFFIVQGSLLFGPHNVSGSSGFIEAAWIPDIVDLAEHK